MSPLVTQAGPVAHSPGWPPASPAPGPHARGRGSSSGSGVWTASAPGSPLCSHCDRLASSSTAGAVGSAGPGGTVARSSGTCVVFAWSSAGLLQPPRMRTSTPDRDVARRRTEEDEEAITGSFSKKTPPKKTAVSHRWNHYTFKSVLAIAQVQGIPPHHPRAFRLSDAARGRLAHRLAPLRTPEGREALILDWSRARGRVSSTEVADLTGLSKVSAGKLLTGLADAGHLEGSRSRRRGRGFFYLPVNPGG